MEDLCFDHWHCNPLLAAHDCRGIDRSKPCPSCGERNLLAEKLRADYEVARANADYNLEQLWKGGGVEPGWTFPTCQHFAGRKPEGK